MEDDRTVPLHVSQGCLIASVQGELTLDRLAALRTNVLSSLRRGDAHGVVFDLKGVELLDTLEFVHLKKIVDMAALMGARSVLVGLRPGIVAALVSLGVDIDGLQGSSNLDRAIALLNGPRGG